MEPRGRWSGRRARGAPMAAALLLLLLGGEAGAHTITPNPVILRDLNGQVEVTVADCCGCSAVVSAASAAPNIFLVSPPQQTGVVTKFIITPVFYGPGVLVVHIKGQGTNPQGEPCEEDSVTQVPVMVTLPPESTGNTPSAGTARDPINTFIGEFYLEEPPDLAFGGPTGVMFRRRYSSRFLAEGMIACGLGENWTHNYNGRLIHADGPPATAEVVTEDGRVVRFEEQGGAWVLTGPSEIAYQLAENDEEFVLGDPRRRTLTYYDFAGRPYRVSNGKGGQCLSLLWLRWALEFGE